MKVVVYFGLWTSEGISKVNSKNDKISKQRLNPCFILSLQLIAGLNSITGHFDNLNLCITKAFTCRKDHLSCVDSKIPQWSHSVAIFLLWKVCYTPQRVNKWQSLFEQFVHPRKVCNQRQAGISSPRRLITIYKGHQHLKIFHRMSSLRKSLEEKYDEVIFQQMASPSTLRREVWWRNPTDLSL